MEARGIGRRYDHRFRDFVHETGDIELELRKEVVELRERNAKLLAVLRLVVVLLKVCDVSLVRRRVPAGKKKSALLRAVDRSKNVNRARSCRVCRESE